MIPSSFAAGAAAAARGGDMDAGVWERSTGRPQPWESHWKEPAAIASMLLQLAHAVETVREGAGKHRMRARPARVPDVLEGFAPAAASPPGELAATAARRDEGDSHPSLTTLPSCASC